MKDLFARLVLPAALGGLLISVHAGSPPSTAFTYQGQLQNNGSPANGSYDLTFTLFNVSSGGSALEGPLTNSATGVTNGLFIVTLDYGSGVFTGANYWLEIGVCTNGGSGFTTLTPRQEVTPTPYAIYSLGANTAGTANGVASGSITAAGIATGQLVKSLNGLTDAVTLAAGSNVTITPNGNTLTVASSGGGGGSGWSLTGNAGTTPGINFLGTTDNEPLELWVNNTLAFLLQPGNGNSPNVIGGSGGSADSSVGGGTIAGGINNTLSNSYPTVGGGYANHATGSGSVVGGGYNNTASGREGTVSGGAENLASGIGSFVGGGGYDGTTLAGNTANGLASTVAGGIANSAFYYAAVGGGWGNSAEGYYAAVVGGYSNSASGSDAFVGGGTFNTASGFASTAPGGVGNIASGNYSFAAGSEAQALNNGSFVWADDSSGAAFSSTADNQFNVRANGGVNFVTGGAGMTIDGRVLGEAPGFENTAIGYDAFSSNTTGINNTATGQAALFSNTTGRDNTADGDDALYSNTTGGANTASGQGALFSNTTAIGNTADGEAALLSNTTGIDNTAIGSEALSANTTGIDNTAIGYGALTSALNCGENTAVGYGALFLSNTNANTAVGSHALYNSAGGPGNTAVGFYALQALQDGGDNIALGSDAGYSYSGDESGNIVIGNAGSTGENNIIRIGDYQSACYLAGTVYANGTFVSSSDRNAKENFKAVDAKEVLEKVAAMPVSRWNYKQDDKNDHIGPMAQDFYAAFNVGPDDKHITTVDESGVALAAIQGLNQKLEARSQALEAENADLKQRLAAMQEETTSRLARLEKALALVPEKSAPSLAVASGVK